LGAGWANKDAAKTAATKIRAMAGRDFMSESVLQGIVRTRTVAASVGCTRET
jgi:hypothetical protein